MSEKEQQTADVIVIGAGILGTFHAYFVAQKGLKVLLLERHALPIEASTRNFGMVVQTIVETDSPWSAYALKTRETYQHIQQQHDITVRQHGSLYLASTESERLVLLEFYQRFASTTDCLYLEATEACARYPFVLARTCTGALLFPNDLMMEPRLLLRQLLPYIVETSSVNYRPYTTVVEVSSNGSSCRVKAADGQEFYTEHVFVCSGAEYRLLFPELFLKSGMQVCKLQMLRTVPQPGPILPHNILSGYSIRRYPAFRACHSYQQLEAVGEDIQRYGLHPLLKQAADGTVIIGDSHEYTSFPETSAGTEYTNFQITRYLLHYAQKLVELPTWEIQSMWNGYYLLHPQQQIYTETIDQNIHIVTGIAGKGMSTGPGFAHAHIEAVLR